MMCRRVLITGGTGKIGRALSFGFAKAGWEVIITSRSQERAEILVKELNAINARNNHGLVWEGRIDSPEIELINLLTEREIQPHCLINNVRDQANLNLGIDGRPPLSSWVNEFYLGVVVACELAMQLSATNNGFLENVINIASIYGIVAPNLSLYSEPVSQSAIHYGVCKAALIHLTKELAVRMTCKGIRVNAISYGGVEGRVDNGFLQRYKTLCPQERMLTEEDLAGPALFLSSPAATGITGHNLVVDGGWSIW